MSPWRPDKRIEKKAFKRTVRKPLTGFIDHRVRLTNKITSAIKKPQLKTGLFNRFCKSQPVKLRTFSEEQLEETASKHIIVSARPEKSEVVVQHEAEAISSSEVQEGADKIEAVCKSEPCQVQESNSTLEDFPIEAIDCMADLDLKSSSR